MTFVELLRKAKKHWEDTHKVYHITEEDLLSVCIDSEAFVFTPDFWEEEGEHYNIDLIEDFERKGYLIRNDKTDHPEIINSEYVYEVIK